jgi:glycosyltransferase involved in cell wall biosynthesis
MYFNGFGNNTTDIFSPFTGDAAMNPQLSVVMPAYNEAANIEDAVGEIREHILDRVARAALVVVNDGSSDRTGEILHTIASSDSRIRVIDTRNEGHGAAILTGARAAEGEYLFLVDSDRQIPVCAFERLWESGHGIDGAFGRRITRDDPPIRIVVTTIARGLIFVLFGIRCYDANVPFKLIKKERFDTFCRYIPPAPLTPSLLLSIFAAHRGWRIATIDVEHRERSAGETVLKKWRLLRFCINAFAQLVTFRLRLVKDKATRNRQGNTDKSDSQ